MQLLKDALFAYAQQQNGCPIKESCDMIAFYASQAFGAKLRVTPGAPGDAPALSLADIAKLLVAAKGTKISVREAYFVMRTRAPSHAEAIAAGRLLSKLYAASKRGPTSLYEIVEIDRRTLLDAGIAEA